MQQHTRGGISQIKAANIIRDILTVDIVELYFPLQIKHIKLAGGPAEPGPYIRRGMKRIFKNELALVFSMSGQSRGKNKEHQTFKFSGTKIYKCLQSKIINFGN